MGSRYQMKNSAWWTLLMGFSVWLAGSVEAGLEARGCRPELIPNGGVNRCSNCHVRSRGGGRRTPFGQDVRDVVRSGSCAEFWEAELAALDSDGDGRSNGEELLDPSGSWRPEEAPPPGDPARVTNPGVPDEAPPVLFTRGDSNSSGTVDISDGVFTLGFLFRSERRPTCDSAADSNGDGGIDISDAVYLFQYLFAGGNPPPAPFPGCGGAGKGAGVDCEASAACD
tara:strand:- start:42 stop:719 length:678 start_codon:yes stop_codon:yes gene_type:complete